MMGNLTSDDYLDAIEVMVVVLDSKGNVTLVNRKSCEVLGYSEKEILGKNWFNKFIAQENRGEVRSVFNKLIKGETELVECYKNFIMTKSGAKIIAWHNSILEDDSGGIAGILSAGENVTRKEKLEESSRRFKELVDNAGDIIQCVDPNGYFVYVNNKWEKTLGYNKEEAKKIRFMKIIRKDMVPHCVNIFKELENGKSFKNVDVVFVSKDGKETFVEGNINSRIKTDKTVETTGIFRDVTGKKRVEEELRERIEESEKFSSLSVDRELRMVELKKEINDLSKQLNGKSRYKTNYESDPVKCENVK